MDIHKPKPIHGWKDFAKEIGSIVLGVSIALAAEQGVEWWHWKNQVAEAREFIASEVIFNVRHAVVELRTEPCTERRLDELSKILDDASRTGSLPPVGTIGAPPRRGWFTSTWDSVIASQTATHFSRKQLANISYLYNLVQSSAPLTDSEMRYWGEINTMAGPGRRLDPAAEQQLRAAISTARSIHRNLAYIAMLLVEQASSSGLPFSKQDRDEIERVRKLPLTARSYSHDNISPMSDVCRPLGAAPAQYGEGILPGARAVMPDVLKTLPKFGGP